jgi:hypothetical protein
MDFYPLQEVYLSTQSLCIMIDSTFRRIEKMRQWKFSNKDEMKFLGGSINRVGHKFTELAIIGIWKIVEDYGVHTEKFLNRKFTLSEELSQNIPFVTEAMIVNNLCNVIKHDSGIIDPTNGGRSAKKLVNKLGIDDETPIIYLNQIYENPENALYVYLYKINAMCSSDYLLNSTKMIKDYVIPDEEMAASIRSQFLYTLPGYDESENADHTIVENSKLDSEV